MEWSFGNRWPDLNEVECSRMANNLCSGRQWEDSIQGRSGSGDGQSRHSTARRGWSQGRNHSRRREIKRQALIFSKTQFVTAIAVRQDGYFFSNEKSFHDVSPVQPRTSSEAAPPDNSIFTVWTTEYSPNHIGAIPRAKIPACETMNIVATAKIGQPVNPSPFGDDWRESRPINTGSFKRRCYSFFVLNHRCAENVPRPARIPKPPTRPTLFIF